VVPSDKTRGNGHTLKHRRLLLNIRRHYFTVAVTEHWHRLPRVVEVESPSSEIFKNHLDNKAYPGPLAVGSHASGRGLGQVPPEVPSNLKHALIL